MSTLQTSKINLLEEEWFGPKLILYIDDGTIANFCRMLFTITQPPPINLINQCSQEIIRKRLRTFTQFHPKYYTIPDGYLSACLRFKSLVQKSILFKIEHPNQFTSFQPKHPVRAPTALQSAIFQWNNMAILFFIPHFCCICYGATGISQLNVDRKKNVRKVFPGCGRTLGIPPIFVFLGMKNKNRRMRLTMRHAQIFFRTIMRCVHPRILKEALNKSSRVQSLWSVQKNTEGTYIQHTEKRT